MNNTEQECFVRTSWWWNSRPRKWYLNEYLGVIDLHCIC